MIYSSLQFYLRWTTSNPEYGTVASHDREVKKGHSYHQRRQSPPKYFIIWSLWKNTLTTFHNCRSLCAQHETKLEGRIRKRALVISTDWSTTRKLTIIFVQRKATALLSTCERTWETMKNNHLILTCRPTMRGSSGHCLPCMLGSSWPCCRCLCAAPSWSLPESCLCEIHSADERGEMQQWHGC